MSHINGNRLDGAIIPRSDEIAAMSAGPGAQAVLEASGRAYRASQAGDHDVADRFADSGARVLGNGGWESTPTPEDPTATSMIEVAPPAYGATHPTTGNTAFLAVDREATMDRLHGMAIEDQNNGITRPEGSAARQAQTARVAGPLAKLVSRFTRS